MAELYHRNYRAIANHIIRNNGSEAEAQDIFQHAIVILWEKVVQNRLTLTSSVETYLFSICKNLWLKELRKKKNFPQTELANDEQGIVTDESTEDDERELSKQLADR